MDVEVVEEKDDVLKLKLEDANEAIANTLRRFMVSKVPTLSVQHLDITKNQSGIFDEVLAHRVGQVPFTVPANVEEDDDVHIALKQEGPGTVLAEDLKADNDEAEPVHPETVIVDLKDGQEVEFEGVAQLGTGQEHARHQGGTVGYEKVGEGEYEFRIESTSGYSNKELFNKAIEEALGELDDFEEAVEDL
ncbi:MAG: hypothetical protein ABEI58_03235 [Candidatus Nanohaloarchaea archaeon]